MHPSSVENMRRAKRLVGSLSIGLVLDVGGDHRSYKDLFPGCAYHIANIVKAPGVTHVMPGPYELPFSDNLFDLVVSGQMLEHCSNPFRSVAEMKRVLKPSGHMILIAPSAGPRHDKQDCWRFMDDAFQAIADEVGMLTMADWITKDAPDERSRKWQDHVWIGCKSLED